MLAKVDLAPKIVFFALGVGNAFVFTEGHKSVCVVINRC